MAASIPRAALNPAMISIAAAHGITPVTAATWYPTLERRPRVLVPMALDVLMVRDGSLPWADCAMASPPAPQPNAPPVDAASLLPKPFAQLAVSRPVGAYLHWYLPRAFTSGTADTTNQLQFPPIPDRWLVVRLSAGRTSLRRQTRGWVLEAGGPTAQAFDLSTWKEDGAKPDVENPLTALGVGDLSWAGYVDNVQNRLSFFDGTLVSDQVRGPIAYLVCGWFSDPTLDPLGDQTLTSYAAFLGRLQALGWSVDTSELEALHATRGNYLSVATQLGLSMKVDPRILATRGGDLTFAQPPWWPVSSLLHGAVVGIDWPGNSDTQEFGGPPAANAVTVVFGDTMAEALGTLISQADAKPEQAQVVEALQLGVLKELDLPDGRAQLDTQLHANSFVSLSGGPASQEPIKIAPSGPPVAPPSNPAAPGPGIFANTGAIASTNSRFSSVVLNQQASKLEVGALSVGTGANATVRAETAVLRGRLSDVLKFADLGARAPTPDPGGNFTVSRAQPRFYTPRDPVVLVQGGKRAFSHDSGVQTENGLVVCRLTPIWELSWRMPGATQRSAVRGEDILEAGVENGSVPLECDGLLREMALLDTGSSDAITATVAATAGTNFDLATARTYVQVEQTAWLATRRPGMDAGPLLGYSGIAGRLPAAFAVSPASRPWTPIHLDWEVEFDASAGGSSDWSLDELDYLLKPDSRVPAPGGGLVFSGRSRLTGGAANTLSSAISSAISQASQVAGTGTVPTGVKEAYFSEMAATLQKQYSSMMLASQFTGLASAGASAGADAGVGNGATAGATAAANAASPDSPAALTDIATALSQMDVISGGLDGLMTQMRGGVPGDGLSTPVDGKTPDPFIALRAGFLHVKRLRLVDAFGQFVDLCGSNAAQDAKGFVVSQSMLVDGSVGTLALPPRFTAPVRAWLRYLSASDDTSDADYQTSPLCAFVMPNHLDGSLEFFNADGSGAGAMRPTEDNGLAWESAPGLTTTAGQDPLAALSNPHAAALARTLLTWGVADTGVAKEGALSALLRTIDSTRWAVDPFAHQGDEHLCLLLGHPVCVMRAMVRLDIKDPIAVPDNTVSAVAVRLGNLTHWVDGLLGYFVNDDYTRLHVAEAAAPAMARSFGPSQGFLQQINLVPGFYDTFADDLAGDADSGDTAVVHPYIDTSGVLWIRPDQTVYLTLLVEPMSTVHATIGLAPRKEIGMRREWVTAGLAAIAPTFSFGPVLVDPNHIRMPIPTDLNGTWVWDYRSAATQWSESAATNATDDALLNPVPPTAIEGWLKLNPGGKNDSGTGQ